MRGLIVGFGSIGKRHAQNWSALELGPLEVCHRDDDLQAALARKPDAVLVCNPTSLHIETACAALQAGAHVLVEKPLGNAQDGVTELLRAADITSKTLIVGYNFRFHPGLARLKRLIHTNAIGKITSVRAEVGEYLPDWHPWEDYRRGYSARADLGGGPVLTFSHELDTLCWLLGQPPQRLTAFATRSSSLEIDTEDVAEIVLEFPSRILATVHLDYIRRPPQRAIELVGEAGVVRWEYEANRLLRYAPATRQWTVEEGDPRYERNQMYRAELRQFAALIRGEGRGELATGEQAAAILSIALAALRSSREGRAIEFDNPELPEATWLTSLRTR